MRWCKWGRLGGVAEGTGGSTEIRMAFGGCWEVVDWDGGHLRVQVATDRGC
jgi:hypothetical protein